MPTSTASTTSKRSSTSGSVSWSRTAGSPLVEWGDMAEPSGLGIADRPLASGPAGEGTTGADEDGRAIAIAPIGTAWDGRWTRLVAALAPWAAPR